MFVRSFVVALAVLQLACSDLSTLLVQSEPPPRVVEGTSCPTISDFIQIDGRTVALLAEVTEDAQFLARVELDESGWTVGPVEQVGQRLLAIMDVGPESDAFAVTHTSTAQEPFAVLHNDGASWSDTRFNLPLDFEHQNFPNQLVTLGAGRAALEVWQSRGLERPLYRSYLFDGENWAPISEWQSGVTSSESLHQGPGGELWRMRYDFADESAEAELELSALTEHGWQVLHTGLQLPRGAFLRLLKHAPGRTIAVFDNYGPDGRRFWAFRLDEGGEWTRLPDASWGQNTDLHDLDLDAAGRPLLTTSELTRDEGTVVRVQRLTDAGWETLARLHAGSSSPLIGYGFRAALAPTDELLIGWSEGPWVDTGFSRHTDCAIRMARVAL